MPGPSVDSIVNQAGQLIDIQAKEQLHDSGESMGESFRTEKALQRPILAEMDICL